MDVMLCVCLEQMDFGLLCKTCTKKKNLLSYIEVHKIQQKTDRVLFLINKGLHAGLEGHSEMILIVIVIKLGFI